jgi:hypothetical protein
MTADSRDEPMKKLAVGSETLEEFVTIIHMKSEVTASG